MVLTTLGYYVPWIVLSSLQLTLPEGTQPRWGHTVTSFRLDDDRVHATTFGGCPDFDFNRSDDDDPKLADTTVMEFGEWNSALYAMFLTEIREEGGWGRWELKTLLIKLEGVNYPNVASLRTLTCNHS